MPFLPEEALLHGQPWQAHEAHAPGVVEGPEDGAEGRPKGLQSHRRPAHGLPAEEAKEGRQAP